MSPGLVSGDGRGWLPFKWDVQMLGGSNAEKWVSIERRICL